jgi:hypothetical protein
MVSFLKSAILKLLLHKQLIHSNKSMFVIHTTEDFAIWDGLRMVFDSANQRFIPFQTSLHQLSDIVGIQISDLAAFAQGTFIDLNSIQHSYYELNAFGECKRDLSGNPIVDTTPIPDILYEQRIAAPGEIARLLEISLETAATLVYPGMLAEDLVLAEFTPGVTIPTGWKMIQSGTWTGLADQVYTFWSVLLK